MLQQFGDIASFSGFDFQRISLQILVAHGDVAIAVDLHENGKKTQTGVPYYDFFVAALNDLWIDEGPGVFTREFQKNDTLQDPQLRSGNAASVSRLGAPMSERIGEVGYQITDL